MEQLQQLHMGKASFKVGITRKAAGTFDSNGYDDVTFLISTNVGEPLKPLVKVASGGELSRHESLRVVCDIVLAEISTARTESGVVAPVE